MYNLARSEMAEDLLLHGIPDEPSEVHFGEWNDQIPDNRTIRSRIDKTSFGLLFSLLFCAAFILLIVGLSYVVNLAAATSSGWLLWKGIQWFRRIRAPRYLARLVDLPCIAPTFPVTVRVKSRGHLCWQDEGVVTIQNGYLHFQGIHTSFGLRSQDCWPTRSIWRRPLTARGIRKSRSADAFSKYSYKAEVHASFNDADGVDVSFDPYNSLPELGSNLVFLFRPHFEEWQRTPCDEVAYSTFPDLTRSKAAGKAVLIQILLPFALLIFGLCLLFFGSDFPWLHTAIGLGFSAAAVGIVGVLATRLVVKRFDLATEGMKARKLKARARRMLIP